MSRLPLHVINGIAVACGIGLLQLAFGRAIDAHAAALALGGAICTSLADVPNTVSRGWRQVAAAAAASSLATALVVLLQPWPLALAGGIALVGLLSTLLLAWGPRAGPVSFSAVLSLVFAMALPPEPGTLGPRIGWHAAGALTYLAVSIGVGALLQSRYRSGALAAAQAALAALLRSRARLLAPGASADPALLLQDWIAGEARLAERLQAARDLLFAAPANDARVRRENTALLHLIELRDLLLASRLDLELLGEDAAASLVRHRLAQGLTSLADALDGRPDALPAQPPAPGGRLAPEAFEPGDPRERLLPSLADRLRYMDDEVRRLQAVMHGGPDAPDLDQHELRRFVAPEGWPLAALRPHRTLDSPVLRHALRAALALSAAYLIALALPWTSHPQWLVLSVAVVLRGNLEQTLARRNLRVAGTVLGCGAMLLLAQAGSPALLSATMLVAIALAHGFAVERYLVTAAAATVMALMQVQLMHPAGGFPIGERLADTVLGALLAWAFSFVLPAWERRSLPRAVARTVGALATYAHGVLQSLGPQGARGNVELRLARRQAYDALGALAATMKRAAAEPERVRPPLQDLARLLDQGQRLMAHLSMVRMTLVRRGDELREGPAAAALQRADAALHSTLGAPLAGRAAAAAWPDAAAETSEPLPQRHPAQDVLPWLLRRLEVTVREGQAVAAAARAVLARHPPRPPAAP